MLVTDPENRALAKNMFTYLQVIMKVKFQN